VKSVLCASTALGGLAVSGQVDFYLIVHNLSRVILHIYNSVYNIRIITWELSNLSL